MTIDNPKQSTAIHLIASEEELRLLRRLLSGNVRKRSEEGQVLAEGGDDCERTSGDASIASVRSAIRIYIGTSLGLNAWDWVSRTLLMPRAARM